MKASRFQSPFLKRIQLSRPQLHQMKHPFTIPAFARGFDIRLPTAVTFFAGENGTGKSTLLEAIANNAGFNLGGGNRNHASYGVFDDSALAPHVKMSWLPKMSSGFFMRAETFFDFASYVEALAADDPSILKGYGGRSLHSQSHGESFLSLFTARFGKRGLYLLDEPEAALSPMRQLSFLALMKQITKAGDVQLIVATHSPILMSYPDAQILSFDGGPIAPVAWKETEHYKLTKAFLDSPERYLRWLLSEV